MVASDVAYCVLAAACPSAVFPSPEDYDTFRHSEGLPAGLPASSAGNSSTAFKAAVGPRLRGSTSTTLRSRWWPRITQRSSVVLGPRAPQRGRRSCGTTALHFWTSAGWSWGVIGSCRGTRRPLLQRHPAGLLPHRLAIRRGRGPLLTPCEHAKRRAQCYPTRVTRTSTWASGCSDASGPTQRRSALSKQRRNPGIKQRAQRACSETVGFSLPMQLSRFASRCAVLRVHPSGLS